jgi:hypothetical protein
MTSVATGILDEADQRLHATGPEFDGWLSNHGPVAAETMTRCGQARSVHQWLDNRVRRLDEFPRGIGPIGAHWRQALGNPRGVVRLDQVFPPRGHRPAVATGTAGRWQGPGASHRACPQPGLLGRAMVASAGHGHRTPPGHTATAGAGTRCHAGRDAPARGSTAASC